MVESVRPLARHLQAAAQQQRFTVVAPAVVAPGIVDPVEEIARFSANIGWLDVPLRATLRQDLGVAVAIAHDVGAAGVAERELGQAMEVPECLIVVIGTGIAGVVITLARSTGAPPAWPASSVTCRSTGTASCAPAGNGAAWRPTPRPRPPCAGTRPLPATPPAALGRSPNDWTPTVAGTGSSGSRPIRWQAR